MSNGKDMIVHLMAGLIASLKTEVEKLDIDKLAPVPVNLIELSDVVKKDVVKKTEYDKLVTKVNKIDIF